MAVRFGAGALAGVASCSSGVFAACAAPPARSRIGAARTRADQAGQALYPKVRARSQRRRCLLTLTRSNASCPAPATPCLGEDYSHLV
jgi:hypothetical protein